VGIQKAGAALNDRDLVSAELMPDHFQFAFQDSAYASGQVFFAYPFLQRITASVESALAESGHVHDRFSHRLARNGARVKGDSAKHPLTVNDRHLLAEFRRGDGAFLSGRATADHYQVISCFIHCLP
jgi:hypothetical protein